MGDPVRRSPDQGAVETTTLEWIKALAIVFGASILVIGFLLWFVSTFMFQSCGTQPGC